MIKFYKIPLAGLIYISLLFTVSAQKMNNTLYFMQNVPQSNQLNPAIQPECKVFLGFPGLSSVYLNYSNSSFAYDDIITDGTGIRQDSLVVDINSFHDALKSSNFISEQVDLTLFALGIRAKKFFFTLDVIEKQEVRLGFDKELVRFLKDGNFDYRGRTSNWGGLGLDANYYHEIALGASKILDDKWTVGVKAKLLFGVANVHMEDSDISVATSASGDQIDLISQHRLRASLPIEQVGLDSDGFVDDIDFDDEIDEDFFTNTDNKGFAIDLGMAYQMDKKTRLFASIIDLGSIKWKTDTYEFSQNSSYTWRGADWSQSGNSNDPNYREIEDVFEDLTDSITDEFRTSHNTDSYSTGLPTKIYLGGTRQVTKNINLGALSRTEIYNGKIQTNLSFSANARLIRNISTSISYSIVNNSFNNLGFGLATKLGPAQFYVVSDNIMAAFNPGTARLVNARFGINFLFGCRDRTKIKDSCSFEEKRKNRRKPLYK